MRKRSLINLGVILSLILTTAVYSLGQTVQDKYIKITILHTNDTHSRIEPFPMDGSRNQGLGGVAKRAEVIRNIREENEHVLLLDAGDYFQGTPYFNFYSGELEIMLMNELGYEVATIGNHEFDLGLDNLARQLGKAKFQIVNANYGIEDTPLEGILKPYTIIRKGPIRIGVFGLGVEMRGLVPEKFMGNTIYNDPVLAANETAAYLKNEEKCDYVICLSHLGLEYDDATASDLVIAKNSQNIDLVIGGHTHSFLNEPIRVMNAIGKEVLINHAGWGGIILGRIDVFFEPKTLNKWFKSENIKID
ncbi:MAG TPA: metallophosphatase [Saprospirales bacterium]|nr:metallophosphatase [Saprospirales bacterium]